MTRFLLFGFVNFTYTQWAAKQVVGERPSENLLRETEEDNPQQMKPIQLLD